MPVKLGVRLRRTLVLVLRCWLGVRYLESALRGRLEVWVATAHLVLVLELSLAVVQVMHAYQMRTRVSRRKVVLGVRGERGPWC